MGYFGFMGMNNVGGYGPYGMNSPFANGPNGGKMEGGKPAFGNAEGNPASEGNKARKTGFSGFFQGLKNGLVNTVKGLFTLKGLLLTAGTMALVAVTGGAALIPLAALGLGLGGYQTAKGIKNHDTEQIGEGTFMMGASLLGTKLAPKTVGSETLADTSLWGKLKAPFIGKGAFQNPEATYWSTTKQVATNKINGWYDNIFGRAAGTNASGEAIEAKESWFKRTNENLRNGTYQERTRRFFTSAPANPNPSNGQNPNTGTHVTFTERAQNYLKKVKDAPSTASAYMGTVFAGHAERTKPEEAETGSSAEPGTFYY